MSDVETCVMCGAEIPEGIQVCPTCENSVLKEKTNESPRYERFVFRGDVFFADLNPVVGSETGGVRPVVIIQNNIGNRFSPTVIAAITSRAKKRAFPIHVKLKDNRSGLTEDTTILLEQIRTIDKRRLKHYIGHLDEETMQLIDKAAARSIGLKQKSEDDKDGDNV